MRGSDEAAGRRGGSPTTMRALTVSALVNVAVVALVLSGRGSGRARIQLRPHVLLSQEPHSVATMEGKIRRAAEAAEGDLGREARQRQKRRAAAAKKAVGAGETEGWPRGEFGMRLDHPTQKLSGVHAEIQFNAGHASFGEGALVPKLRNETEEQMQEAAAPEPTPAPEPATQDAMQYGGTYCSASYVVSGVGVPHPWEDTVPKPLNQVSVEAWVKDCSMSAVNGYFGAINNPNDPDAPGAGGVWGDLSGGVEPGTTDAGFMLGMYKNQFAWGIASEGTGRMEWLQAPEHITRQAQCEWVHVAGTYDGANMFIYVNGEYSHCSSTQSGAVIMPAAPTLLMGGYFNPPKAGGKYESVAGTFTGQLDEVRLWTVARSQDDIRANLGTTLIIPIDGLAVYFRFDGQASSKFYKICSEVNGVKAMKGCNSGVITPQDGGSVVEQLDIPFGCGPPAPPGDHSLLNPDFFHTGFNPSASGYIAQPLEDCGPDENSCDGTAYNTQDYNEAGFF